MKPDFHCTFQDLQSLSQDKQGDWIDGVIKLNRQATKAIEECLKEDATTEFGATTYKKELALLLIQWSALVGSMGYSADEIANENLKKLFSRQLRGQLQGSGDDR